MGFYTRLVCTLLSAAWLLGLGGCGQPKWNSDYNLNQTRLKEGVKADALASADTTKPSLDKKLPVEEKPEEKPQKKKKKPNKRYFLGYKVKRGFVRTGGSSSETVETFSYLPGAEEANPYAPLKYYYDTKTRKIYRTSAKADAARYKVLHGPYAKKTDGMLIEEGYYYIGTKHLRWERYRKGEEGILLDKNHYERGFLRDAVVSYYPGGEKRIKEVIPYAYGEVQGTYYRFYENGQVQWAGKYEKGRKIGVWIKYFDFRGRRHCEYQYPETAYDAPAEPYLIKEYDRHGKLVYEKDKFDKRPQAQR